MVIARGFHCFPPRTPQHEVVLAIDHAVRPTIRGKTIGGAGTVTRERDSSGPKALLRGVTTLRLPQPGSTPGANHGELLVDSFATLTANAINREGEDTLNGHRAIPAK